MANEVSKTQIDRLGERLKQGNITEADLRMLDQYRRSFTQAYEVVVRAIRNELGLEPTGRPAKSTTSISEKLRRESIRLTQIQDIAGCRLIATDIANQDAVVQSLTNLFEHTTVVDRRQQPSHGYRAVHVIVSYDGKPIEIQVRTSLQHLWAELSEKFSDVVDPALKYGGGNESIQKLLTERASLVASKELWEVQFANMTAQLSSQDDITDDERAKLLYLQEVHHTVNQELSELLRESIELVEEYLREKE